MAEKRMFSKQIIDSDAFLDMPLSTQALYFHLSMRADDDGFVDNPKKIQRVVSASIDDLNLLVAKRFILTFDNGVIVIKHWRMHNTLRADRYKETVYLEEKATLDVKENRSYTEKTNVLEVGIPDGNQLETQYRLDKSSIDKISIEKDPIRKLIEESDLSITIKEQIHEWVTYKKEKKDTYTLTGFQKLITQIKNNVTKHGEDAVIKLIDESMANNWKGIIWDRLKDKPKQQASNYLDEIIREGMRNESNRNSEDNEANFIAIPGPL